MEYFIDAARSFLATIRSFTGIIPKIDLRYFSSLRVEVPRGDLTFEWTRQLVEFGFTIEKFGNEMIQNDTHVPVYQRMVKYSHNDEKVKLCIEIGVALVEIS